MSNDSWNSRDGNGLPREHQIEAAIGEVRRIADWRSSSPDTFDQRLHIARAAISTFDATAFISIHSHQRDREFVISTLQKLAYHEPDAEGVRDIADWCMNQWLQLVQRDGESPGVLRGLGQAWLARSQSILARIHSQEGSISSGSSGRPRSQGEMPPYSSTEEARDAERAAAEADTRAHTGDYVEARTMLTPAVDYFSRAIELADRDGGLDGDLLSEAAEASMSLGNVSYSHSNEQQFHRAVRYLRRASQINGYRLSPYLQAYLDEYGRLVD